MKYVSPVAELVALEAVSVILTSAVCTDDGPCITYDSGCEDEGLEG